MRLNSYLLKITFLLFAATSFGEAPPVSGWQHLTFSERSPLSARDVLLRRLETTVTGSYNLANESFTAFVPPNYNPRTAHGLLVWTGVSEFSPAWLDVLSRHRLILIFADSQIGHISQHGVHLDAVYNMERLYTIDTNRVYVAGFSAGGQMATHMVRIFPEVFRGGLFLMGGYFYLSRDIGHGQREPTVEQAYPNWVGPLDQIKKNTRLVIMKGGNDPQWTPQEGRSDYQALWLDGFRRVSYFDVPGLGHSHPDVSWFEKGVTALDQPPKLIPPIISPTKGDHPLPGQLAQAQRILATGRYYLELKPPQLGKARKEKIRKSNRDVARNYLKRVLDEYPTTPAAVTARTLLAGLDQKEKAK